MIFLAALGYAQNHFYRSPINLKVSDSQDVNQKCGLLAFMPACLSACVLAYVSAASYPWCEMRCMVVTSANNNTALTGG